MEGEKGEGEGGSGVWMGGCMGRVQSKFFSLGQSSSPEMWTEISLCVSNRFDSNVIT